MRKTVKYDNTNDVTTLEEPQLTLEYTTRDLVDVDDSKPNTLNVLSLFSGCGGMDLGFEGGFTTFLKSVNTKICPDFIEKKINKSTVLLRQTRFKTVFANDILDGARNAWVNHFSKKSANAANKFHLESVVDLVRLHRNGVSVFPKNVDVVTGGFPCQDFSVAGKRNGFNSHKNHKGEIITTSVATEETRGKLYMWMKEVIEITQPNIFIAENVKGLVNLSNVKEIIQNDFSNAGGNSYIVLDPQVLHAADYGVPQSRERVIFIGIKKSALKKGILEELSQKEISDRFNPYPPKTHAYTSKEEGLVPPVKLEDIFQNLTEPDATSDTSQKYFSKAKYMGKHCQGQVEVRLDGIAPTIRAEHHGNIEFRRLADVHGGKYTEELKQNLIERRLTPRECALIQTFPPDYEFVIENRNSKGGFLVSPSQAYKIIGNAVPPLLAYNIARRIESIWDVLFKK